MIRLIKSPWFWVGYVVVVSTIAPAAGAYLVERFPAIRAAITGHGGEG